jgi:phospholipase C
MRGFRLRALVGFGAVLVVGPIVTVTGGARQASALPTPIQHVVVILQENHSFDNVLGQLCIQTHRACNAASTGRRLDGSTIPLKRATDIVPGVNHVQRSQIDAINGGKMNGWEKIEGCAKDECYTQYDPSQIPALAAMAAYGAISDTFFSRNIVPSWGGHLDFFAQTLDGFVGNNPKKGSPAHAAPGWGCDSKLDAQWNDPKTHRLVYEPACIPDRKGHGPYRASPVKYTPTFGDRLDAAHRTWGIYGATDPTNPRDKVGYKWAICPTFAECLYSAQHKNLHQGSQFFTDAARGKLPNFSILVPDGAGGATSQHNGLSMMYGDNYIASEVNAIERGPNAKSTAIFIYYDDCGCFFDHVVPPAGLGIRLPLVIVSPYARPGYTDHTVATNSSILAYAEHVLNVKPINQLDKTAYNFANSFDYTQTPTALPVFRSAPVPASSTAFINTHPALADDT